MKLLRHFIAFFRNPDALAVGMLFAASSLLFGTWVGAIPTIKTRFGLTDGALGRSLLLGPAGSITGILVSRWLFQLLPVGSWLVIGYATLGGCTVLLIHAPSLPVLLLALYLYGLNSFLNGVASNATVTLVEQAQQTQLMASCHGLYSLGGAASALCTTAFAQAGYSASVQVLFMLALVCAGLWFNRGRLLKHTQIIHSRSALQWPAGSVLGIAFICCITFMAEGCVADWSALYFKDVLHAPPAWLSLGYLGFSLAMTAGRLSGDHFIARWGGKPMVVGGSLLAAVGFAVIVWAPPPLVALAAYVAVGLGCSCIVPVLFSASARIPGVSKVEGFAMVTTGGLLGFLAGPSAIGMLADAANLAWAQLVLVAGALLAALVAVRNPILLKKEVG